MMLILKKCIKLRLIRYIKRLTDMDELIDVCVKNMVNESFTEEQARTYLKEMLPKLVFIGESCRAWLWSAVL